MAEPFKPLLGVDFDGVIFPYSRGWQGGELYETTVTRGFFEWAAEAEKGGFAIQIYSSRSKEPARRAAMQKWLEERMQEWRAEQTAKHSPLAKHQFNFSYAAEKGPFWLTIDDRCVCFEGTWKDRQLQPDAMHAFRSWAQDQR